MTTTYSTSWSRGGAGLLVGAMTGGLIWTALMMVPMLLGADWQGQFSIDIADATGALVMLMLTYSLAFVACLLVLSVVVAPL